MSDYFRALVRVHWADTDAAQVVWHANYFRWFEGAEEQMFRALGRPRQALLDELGILMPRIEVSARFRSPARVDELLAIGVRVSELGERRIGYAFEVREHQTDRYLADGGYRLAVVNTRDFTATTVPPPVAGLLQGVPGLAASQDAGNLPWL